MAGGKTVKSKAKADVVQQMKAAPERPGVYIDLRSLAGRSSGQQAVQDRQQAHRQELAKKILELSQTEKQAKEAAEPLRKELLALMHQAGIKHVAVTGMGVVSMITGPGSTEFLGNGKQLWDAFVKMLTDLGLCVRKPGKPCLRASVGNTDGNGDAEEHADGCSEE